MAVGPDWCPSERDWCPSERDWCPSERNWCPSERDWCPIAFTAQFSVDPARVGQKATLKLDHFVTNIGGGYNPLTGIFTAPVSGVYAFFLTIMSDNTKWIEVTLINDGVHLDMAHADGTPGQSFLDQGSLLVTVHLNQGSKVWNQQQGGASSLRGGAWTVFSGFLIRAD
ncbi:complement C1q-like protein 3 [Littorina saxatilis]|uniref:complement C1q-like protein 3 n=1 Tax=Littorina saxatilis TaxID=31220 RepID=UPI0038B62989